MKHNFKISYGKNVYDKKEISAVIKTLNNSTQMGKSVSKFEKKVSERFIRMESLLDSKSIFCANYGVINELF